MSTLSKSFEKKLVEMFAISLAEIAVKVPKLEPLALVASIEEGRKDGEICITMNMFLNTADVNVKEFMATCADADYPADPTSEQASAVDLTTILDKIKSQ